MIGSATIGINQLKGNGVTAESAEIDLKTAWRMMLDIVNGQGDTRLKRFADGSWQLPEPMTEQALHLFELYLPLCQPPGTLWVIGQLGQSLDGRIATESGESRYINDPEGIEHLHRLRALVDAVVIGSGTAAADDPQLTVRAVPGDNPVRVVLDRERQLPDSLGLFSDNAAPTVRVVRTSRTEAPLGEQVEDLVVAPSEAGACPIQTLIEALQARGLNRVLVEGGGLTVSRFLEAGCLDRLHLIVAPVIMGSGLPAFTMTPLDQLDDALRPDFRRFDLGRDTLFDLILE